MEKEWPRRLDCGGSVVGGREVAYPTDTVG